MTSGSASTRPEGPDLAGDAASPRWFVAHDADQAGDKAAAGWPARAIRVRPPAGQGLDRAHQAGIDLRRWWIEEALPDAFDRQERAAIMEFDGGLSRAEAEHRRECAGHANDVR